LPVRPKLKGDRGLYFDRDIRLRDLVLIYFIWDFRREFWRRNLEGILGGITTMYMSSYSKIYRVTVSDEKKGMPETSRIR
jgi:hypothetical protein